MTEQPDTTAIRAARTLFGYGGVLIPDRDVEALCDALDAARAEADDANHEVMLERSRAEAAEAELAGCQRAHDITDEKRVRAEGNLERTMTHLRGVNLRIAAALAVDAWCEQDCSAGDPDCGYCLMRAALLP